MNCKIESKNWKILLAWIIVDVHQQKQNEHDILRWWKIAEGVILSHGVCEKFASFEKDEFKTYEEKMSC